MQVILPDRSVRVLPPDPVRIEDLVISLGFLPTGVIITRNGIIVPEDEEAAGDDELRIIRVSHGG